MSASRPPSASARRSPSTSAATPPSKLPKAGGLNATVVVLIPYETLMGGIKAAKLDTGEHISAGLARRIACEAGIIPAVLGGKSEVLDLGRSRRLHSRAQRIMVTIEQGGCIEEGCDAPPAFTQMHHPIPWSEGGETNRDGWMLCPSAHRRIHDPTLHPRTPAQRQDPLPHADVSRRDLVAQRTADPRSPRLTVQRPTSTRRSASAAAYGAVRVRRWMFCSRPTASRPANSDEPP